MSWCTDRQTSRLQPAALLKSSRHGFNCSFMRFCAVAAVKFNCGDQIDERRLARSRLRLILHHLRWREFNRFLEAHAWRRQSYDERGALTHFALDTHGSLVHCHNRLHYRQPEASST